MVFVFLAPFLTKAMGVTGLIASILTSNIIPTVYGAYCAKSRHRVEFNYKSLTRIYLLALASATPSLLCTVFLPFPPALKVLTASAVYLISYLTLLPIAHAITKSELQSLERAVRKIGPLKPVAELILKYEYAITRT